MPAPSSCASCLSCTKQVCPLPCFNSQVSGLHPFLFLLERPGELSFDFHPQPCWVAGKMTSPHVSKLSLQREKGHLLVEQVTVAYLPWARHCARPQGHR